VALASPSRRAVRRFFQLVGSAQGATSPHDACLTGLAVVLVFISATDGYECDSILAALVDFVHESQQRPGREIRMTAQSLESRINRVISDAAAQISEMVRAQVGKAGAQRQGTIPHRSRVTASPKVVRRGRPLSIAEADLNRVLKVVAANPNLRTEQLTKKSPLPSSVTKKALAILRASKRVKTKGTTRGMTHVAAA
jgi:hypothetical protein